MTSIARKAMKNKDSNAVAMSWMNFPKPSQVLGSKNRCSPK